MKTKFSVISCFALIMAAVSCASGNRENTFVYEGNPLVRDKYTADPAPMVGSDGRLYVYCGHDECFEDRPGYEGKYGFNITEWLCYSTEDMKVWTDHGVVMKPTDFSWAIGEAWASQAIEYDGRFYFFVSTQCGDPNCKAIGVAVSDNPAGPFVDAIGRPLITDDMTDNGPRGWWNDIDPSVMISSSQTADTCVCSGFPSTNYYTAAQLRTGYDSDYGIRRSLIRFDIPSSIPAASVVNAQLDIEKISGATPSIRAKRITHDWTSSTVTWNSCPPATTKGQSSIATLYRTGSNWYSLDVTSIVEAWINDSAANYGFLLLDDVENDPNLWTTWYSSDANSPHKPELHITYGSNASLLTDVPCYLEANANHLCISCAITNVAAYWSVNGYAQFNCGNATNQEAVARNVHNAMLNAGSATDNNNIQIGFDLFRHTSGSITYGLLAINCWASNNAFTFNTIVSEINAGRPLLLGFAGTEDSPYPDPHMTACAGYLISDDGNYVYVSDAHDSFHKTILFNMNTYNDFVAIARIYQK